MKRILLFLTLTLGATASLASSSYPSAVKEHLSATTAPSCTVCHATNSGGFGTVTRPFGVTMMAAGLGSGNVDSLNNVLDAVEAEGSDSDGDGRADIDELRIGADPNDSSDGGEVPVDNGAKDALRYGFGCSAGGVPPAVVLLLPLALARRRRRRLLPPAITVRCPAEAR